MSLILKSVIDPSLPYRTPLSQIKTIDASIPLSSSSISIESSLQEECSQSIRVRRKKEKGKSNGYDDRYGTNGSVALKKHNFFASINWHGLLAKVRREGRDGGVGIMGRGIHSAVIGYCNEL